MQLRIIEIAVMAAIGFGIVLALNGTGFFSTRIAFAGPSVGANCNIKGNVSITSGERIYHAPGQQDYAATIIRPEYGERWFCTEDEARAAGWRKAGR